MRDSNKIYGAILSAFLAIILLWGNPIQAQTWRSLNGPMESSISKIIVQADTIYIASQELDGFFKKHKNSGQWLFVHFSVSYGTSGHEIFNTIEVASNGTYFAGLPGGAVPVSSKANYIDYFYTSNDFGKSWKPMGNGLGHCSGGIYPGVNSTIILDNGSLIVDCGYNIFKYSEEEETFKETSGNPTLSSNPVFSFFEYEDTLAAGRVSGFEYSTDDGDSWTASAFDSVEVFSFEYMDGKWFAGTNAGLYTATSISGTFQQIDELSNVPVHALHGYQNHIIVGTDSGAFRINPDDLDIQAVFQDSYTRSIKAINSIEETILIGTGDGLYECTAEEENCTLTGVPNSRIRTINFQGEDTLWVGSTTGVHRYFVETGQWDSSSVPISGTTLTGNIIPLGSNRFHSFGYNYFYTCYMENSQCDSTQVDPGNRIFDVKQNTAGDLFLASSKRVFKSTDNGENWETIFTNPDNINFSVFTFSDSLLFINGGELIKYSLNNSTYDTLSNSIDVITSDGTIYSSVNGIQKSTDFGNTWTTILQSSHRTNDGLGALKFLLYDENLKKLYAITTEGGAYVTKDEGANWGVNVEMHPIYLEDTEIGPDGTLYLGTGNAGVFTNTKPINPPITISNEEEPNSSAPKSFNLQQNYPNPFNPSTTIPFELHQATEVNISLYNVFGQKVREYNLGRKQAGAHQYQIDMSQQASGVYFLRVRAGANSQAIKISLIK